jgi:nitroimidazol reductase NimA-like FMN-containing flavoprotein (pyridoxamine 5'-phosphate oxidase superfamily)
MTPSAPVFRQLDENECRAMLASHHVGRLAYSLHDRLDIEPLHYAYDGQWIYGRTSLGSKLATLAHHPWCAFEVDEVRGVFDWSSVVVKGSFHLLDPASGSPDRYGRALELVTTLVPETFTPGDPVPHRSVIFGVFISEMSGRTASNPST